MNIYILENNKSFRNDLEIILLKWFKTHHLLYNLMISTSNISEFLLLKLEKSTTNIYFVNVTLNDDEPKGLEIAHSIRKRDSNGHIILLDESDRYAPLTYKYMISALDYIVKSDNVPQEIFSCLDYVNKANKFIKKNNTNFVTCHREIEFQVDSSNILYFENDMTNRETVYMVTKDSKFRIKERISCIESQYSDFFRSHRSYVINIRNVFGLDTANKKAVFQDGSSCPVSNRNWTVLKKRLASIH